LTLTGLGERVHLISPEIGLETHIQDIVGVLEYEDLTDVILVGHSQHPVVLGAADRVPERVAQLVYIDGFIPANGQTILESGPEDWRGFILSLVTETAQGQVMNLPDGSLFGLSDPADIEWFNVKKTPEPFKKWTEPLVLRDEAAANSIPRTYINCIGDAPGSDTPPEWAAGFNYRELHAPHLAMISHPQLLADMLLGLILP
jgi:pimeloyl-ACP methyl ester carboxylesterase